MSQVGTGVLAKLQDLLPNQIGDNAAYSTAYVNELILAGHFATTDRAETQFVSQTITLVADTHVYDLDSKFITVASVDYKSDGSTIDGHLKAVTMDDLDRLSYKWRDDRGTRPEQYVLLSAPGTMETETDVSADGAQILIYRPFATVDSQVITVNGLGAAAVTEYVPEDVQNLCLVPYCMAHLYAQRDPLYAKMKYEDFMVGLETVRPRYLNKITESMGR